MNKPLPPKTPLPIDDNEDRMGAVEPLDFPDDENRGRIGDERPLSDVMEEFPPRRLREAGLTGGATDDHQPTDDDLSPETLIREDGARSAHEHGHGKPADKDLSVVDEDAIGGGVGLDEEELARDDPLDSARYRKPDAS